MTGPTGHGAAGSALGYIFQTKYALLELLRADATAPGAGLSLELFDDVAWDLQGEPFEQVQIKHTIHAGQALSDTASAWWSAIRVWLDAGSVAAPDAPRLVLVTNARATSGTALHALRPDSRDPDAAELLLNEAATDSRAKETAATRARFLQLPVTDRRAFVNRIVVLDRSPDVSTVDDEVARLLRYVLPPATEPGRRSAFLDQVWGRWWDVAVRLLRGEMRTITGEQWQAVVSAVRDDFTVGRLPTTVADLSPDRQAEVHQELGDRRFVHQLRWIGASHAILRRCVVDYYRSTQQQIEWAEDSLVHQHELDTFRRRLREEWELAFAFAKRRLPPEATEADQEQAGLDLLEAMLDQTRVFLRDDYREPFLGRGTLHELADRSELGWHPDFEERLRALLLNEAS
jgi:hypothetical protein